MSLMLTDDLMQAVGLSPSNAALRARYDLLRQMVEAAVVAYCKWPVEQQVGVVEYYDGTGYRDVILRGPYASAVTEVRLDMNGQYGQAAGAFPASSVLTAGGDYALVGGREGLLRRTSYSAPYFPSDLVFSRRPGGLAYRDPACWPAGYGNVRVTYTYGFATIPDDIRLAVVTGVGIAVNSTKWGYPVQSEGLGAHNYSLSVQKEPAFAEVKQLLGRYRDLSLGIGL